MQIEIAKYSHIGNREENQDRVEILIGDHSTLGMVLDGMGGHSAGAEAAMTAIATMSDKFRKSKQPLPFPERFLSRTVGDAHEALVGLGRDEHLDAKPRATCALCLIQDNLAYWAHLGDTRAYHLRDGKVHERTRDHTHVELLLQEGLIDESEIATHPMRSFVEQCLGGDRPKPPVTVSEPCQLEPGDILLLCSDGFWGGLKDREIAAAFAATGGDFDAQEKLQELVEQAVANNTPGSDNTTAAVIVYRGND
ncbi:MAG: protein phosphatase 2C domain-containing protein [Gammaproteobacteria bacterium]|nr:protein phosphatase 2C domain-containing protein [Gammaproteobacteria bacterium]NNF62232.1 serine/threonine-protein phosphatase [Gammaproteobacteria bacterium]NNM21029.1 serine/threonine-protein phosphatase [Gammaproteobacteria bacterium]